VIQKQVRRELALESQNGWSLVAALAFLLDLALTGFTFFRIRLDGDLARVAGPVASYRTVLRDPWGFRAGQSVRYPGSGRYMAHITTKAWADVGVPAVKLIVREPVRSLYVTLALTAVAIHLMFVVIGCAYLRLFRPMAVRQTLVSALGLSSTFPSPIPWRMPSRSWHSWDFSCRFTDLCFCPKTSHRYLPL
jgi:hypothetical protein